MTSIAVYVISLLLACSLLVRALHIAQNHAHESTDDAILSPPSLRLSLGHTGAVHVAGEETH